MNTLQIYVTFVLPAAIVAGAAALVFGGELVQRLRDRRSHHPAE